MSLVNKGFDGTVTEADFAMMNFIGAAEGVESDAAWAVTPGTGRQVECAADAGWAFAAGVLSKEGSDPLTKTLTSPTDGQWFLVVRHIDWATNSVSLDIVAGDTTSTTVPTKPPASLPEIDQEPGVSYDQPLAWAWCRSTDTTVEVFDLRKLPLKDRVAEVVNVADLDELHALTAFPESRRVHVDEMNVDFQARDGVWVQDGVATFSNASARNTAYAKANGVYKVASALAKAGTFALWPRRYDVDTDSWKPPVDRGGMLPLRPSLYVSSPSLTNADILDDGTVTVTAATSVTIDGFATDADGKYMIVIDLTTSNSALINMTVRASNSEKTSGYDRSRTGGTGTSTPTSLQALNSSEWVITAAALNGQHIITLGPIVGFADAAPTVMQYTSVVTDNPMTAAAAQATGVLQHRDSTALDGIKLVVASGSMTGTIRFYELA